MSKKERRLEPKNHLFYAEISKGFVVKVLVEVITAPLKRGVFYLTREGIFLKQQDDISTIMFDVTLPRKSFKKYICQEEKIISVNLAHLKMLLKNVKKKDSLIFSIRHDQDSQLFITIKPETAKEVARSETINMVYKEVLDPIDPGTPNGQYKYPVVITSSDFQKIKRQITMGSKSINVMIQGSSYLCFFCNSDIYGTKLEYGEKLDPDEESESVDPAYSENEEMYSIYESTYSANTFNSLLKLPGLCNQMQFYAPTIPEYHLIRISMDIAQQNCTLGHIDVYIKDESTIAYEKSGASGTSSARDVSDSNGNSKSKSRDKTAVKRKKKK